MKLAFTTLGCIEWNLTQIMAKACEYGYAGVDFRGYHGTMDLWTMSEFRRKVATTRCMLTDAGLTVPCLGSSAKMFSQGTDVNASLEEVKRYTEIAHQIGATSIRVFGGALRGNPIEFALPPAATFLNAAADIARSAGIEVLVETHDDWVNTEWLMNAFEVAKFPAGVGVIWDVHHPYRFAGENSEETWRRIGSLTKYTHWKDSVMVEMPNPDGGVEKKLVPKLPGEGDLPLARFYETLDKGGYRGWYTLEWERKWHPEIEPPEVAFPHFVQVMREIEAKQQNR